MSVEKNESNIISYLRNSLEVGLVAKNTKSKKMTVYLFCPDVEARESKPYDNHFFQKQLENFHRRTKQPVFLDKDSAIKYAHFNNNNHAILKAYIDEAAIEGHSDHQLILRENALTIKQIHGCFLPTKISHMYYENPLFDDEECLA